MARSRITNQSQQRLRAPRERALRAKIHDAAIDLRHDFAQFLIDRDLLDDMAREAAARVEPSTNGKAFHVVGAKRAEPIPDEVTRLVDRALARADPLFSKLKIDVQAGLLSESIRSFENGAQNVIRQVGLRGAFNLRNPRVLDALAVRANELAGDVADTTFDAMKETIAREFFLEGRGPEEVARSLNREFDFLSAKRSSMIARTETGVITEMGAFEQNAEIGIEKKRWLSALVEQTRPGHRKAHGQTVPIFEPFIVEDQDGNPEEMLHPLDPDASAGNIVNCFPGDVLVSTVAETLAVTRRPWQGELVEILTRAGHRLSGTPNHPVMTERGWVRLAELSEGDGLVRCALFEDSAGMYPYPKHRDTPLNEVYRLAAHSGDHKWRRGSVMDFHGDGHDGDVDVIWTDRELLARHESARPQPIGELVLASTDAVRARGPRNRPRFEFGGRTFDSTDSIMRRRGSALAVFGRRARVPRQLTCGSATWDHALLQKEAPDGTSGDSALGSNLEFRDAGNISVDQVSTISRVESRGHVYNLQSGSGWYIGNGFVVHNCLCASGPVVEGALRGPWLGE